jgi:hypothetical protein
VAELTITVRQADDGLDIRVGFESDADTLPHEHEADHRRPVGRLFPGLAVVDDPEARVRVRREKPALDPVVG